MIASMMLGALLLTPTLQADPPLEGETLAVETMDRLSSLVLASGDAFRVRDLTLRRDVVSISFERGVLAFLEPVNGRVTGAVFVGSGDVLAMPPDEVERRQVARFTGSPILIERFDTALLRFTDETYQEVVARMRDRPQEDVRADDLEALLPWGSNLGGTSRLLNFRIFQDLIGPSDRPLFFAALRGERLGWFDIAYDQRRAEEVIIGESTRMSGGARSQNIWASFNRRDEASDPELYGSQSEADIDVTLYRIDTRIAPDGELSATARVGFTALTAGERVLPFDLSGSLRLSDVRLRGASIPFFQHVPLEDDVGGGPSDTLLVVLPEPTVAGQQLEVEFDYGGDVLERRGNGVYYVSERIFWYPHVGRLDPSRYELEFHFPSENVLVATGDKIEEVVRDGLKHSRWASASEFVVAGFNYGDFSIDSDETGPVPIYVHVNNDIETVYQDLAIRRAELTERVLRELQGAWRRRNPRAQGPVPVAADFELFSTRRLASNVATEVKAMLAFFSARLGDYPFERLSVSQFPVAFSQGWPTLLYVSTLSFFDQEQRARLELDEGNEWLDLDYVLAHEVAHQWFGNKVSWPSYRDQWIGEGFANYMAISYLEEAAGDRAAREILGRLRARLLSNSGDGGTYEDGGPVWIGQRLTSTAVPDGYTETLYPKATWIVHMLRMLMRDGADASDQAFNAMLREYLEEFDGRSATTWDLKSVAERHMNARLDAGGDGTLDWFFDQWVFGTGVPEYAMSYAMDSRSGDAVTITGQIEDLRRVGFTMPLPLYAEMANGERRFIGDVVVSGDAADFTIELSFVPEAILLDPYGTVLSW